MSYRLTFGDPDRRLAECWRIQDCWGCTHSPWNCGWCPFSSACIPLPNSAVPLLAPVTNPSICPSSNERFELRTRALGCGCSTTTFLSITVTIAATIAALLIGYAISWCAKGIVRGRKAASAGWEVCVDENGERVQGVWERKDLKTRWWPFRKTNIREDDLLLCDGDEITKSWRWWRPWKSRSASRLRNGADIDHQSDHN
ncbi:hypothetical protein P152DRAFT_34848 [Eremomyces bilateralis CBS 781.70]|uniref:PSI domain-containing protein n=1 Tax=Eremomyces bilateralis CBS 781.70 TaxID=1392243 RepID=A0A6G1G3B4_9PEZI|nr:uncharacterized protein P152DRAFT_34848 [Eremomyces bilateralis CBS 781.70]KAF1812410.1 hypothetical protein P152DRAFT_34848 [Eremomyces bilateralis CBS 781.70]